MLQAQRLGHAITDDPGLRVFAHGRGLPLDQLGSRVHALLPVGTTEVRIRSRSWVPAYMVPDQEDCRPLGIAISRLWLDRREVALDSPALSRGWHAVEPGWRWTGGNSHLGVAGVRELSFEIKKGWPLLATDSPAGGRTRKIDTILYDYCPTAR